MTWNRIPGSRRLLVKATSTRSTSRLARTLSGTSDWRRDLVDRAGFAAMLAVGPARLSPAAQLDWPATGFAEIEEIIRRDLPGLNLFGIAIPRQTGRERLSALGRITGNLAVLKLGGADPALKREYDVLELLAREPMPGITTPTPLAYGEVVIATQPVTYLLTTAVSLLHQRVAMDEPLLTFERDLAQRLSSLPRPEGSIGSGNDLVPVHGDLTPWNLRRTPRGLALFDWESAGWGERGSDLVRYRAACVEVRRPWTRFVRRPFVTNPHDPIRAQR